MAVQVLEESNYKNRCRKCTSLLTYSWFDLKKYKTNQDYLGDFDLITGVECPVCKSIVSHSNHY